MKKHETVEEYLARGGKITKLPNLSDPPKQRCGPTRQNKNRSMYDYSDAEFATPLDYWSR